MRANRIVLLFVLFLVPTVNGRTGHPFNLMESSIEQIHQAIAAGTLTCHSLVEQYLERIKAFDQQGPAINSMLYLNPESLAQADMFDVRRRGGPPETGTSQMSALPCTIAT